MLTGVRLPPSGADERIRIAARLRERNPEVGVVALGDRVEPSAAVALLDKGMPRRAYLLTERIRSHDELIGAVTAVATGGSVLDPLIVDALIQAKTRTACSPLSELTRSRDGSPHLPHRVGTGRIRSHTRAWSPIIRGVVEVCAYCVGGRTTLWTCHG